MFVGFIAGNIIYKCFDYGIANTLGLETLRHGTNPINNVKIRIFGGDPSQGGKGSGSTHNIPNSKASPTHNLFYVFKDSEFLSEHLSLYNFAFINILWPFLPRMHAALSTWCFSYQAPDIAKVVSCAISVVVSPPLRFRFSTIDPNRFENDTEYGGAAYKTAFKVEVWRLGVVGSLLTGINTKWFERAKAKPLKIATGVVELTCAVALSTLLLSQITTNPVVMGAFIAGAILA